MILNEEKKDVAVAGNFKTSSFKIAASAKAFDILSSNIYTHKVRAVIRELSCNAHDAHIEAGNDQPFDVHLPTSLEPWFGVRDYGVGLSEQDVREIFTTYFCSTKTGSNDYIGALGLGSKSPFCLVDSFTVASCFGGSKKTYSCYRDEDGEPQIALLITETSEDHAGLEVIVNVDGRVGEFIDEAVEVYQYFQDVPNINLSECTERIRLKKTSYIFNNGKIGLQHGWAQLKAVMGNVAYDIPSEFSDLSGYVRFELGDLSFDPGRENLSLDDKTRNALTNTITTVLLKLKDYLVDEIEKEPTPYKKSLKLASMKTGHTGSVIMKRSGDFAPYLIPHTEKPITYFSKTSYRKAPDRAETHSLPLGPEVKLFLHQPRYETRIRQYLSELGDMRMLVVLLTQQQIDELNIDPEFILDLEKEIPKTETYRRKTEICKEKVFTLDMCGNAHKAAECWSKTDVDMNDTTTERVYVEIRRWKPVWQGGAWYLNSVNRIFRTLQQAGEVGVETPVVYGVKSAFTKTKKFEKGNWISLNDYLQREVKKTAPEGVMKCERSANNTIRYLACHSDLPVFSTFAEKLEQFSKQADTIIYDNLEIKLDYDYSLDIIQKEITDKYPMLEFTNSWELRKPEKLEVVLNYIKGA